MKRFAQGLLVFQSFCDSQKGGFGCERTSASNPTMSIAVCAEGVPSLQIKISWLEFVAGHQRVDDYRRADQRQRHKSEADLRTREILRSDHADLRPDYCARVHDQRDQDVHIAFHCVCEQY